MSSPEGVVRADRGADMARGDVVARCASPSYSSGPPPAVSVVVATCGRASFLVELVDALEKQSLEGAGFEVVVVDDASPDATWATLEHVASGTTLRFLAVRLGANAGQGVARNTGVEMARGRVVAFTDDDCVPTGRWLEALTAPFDGAGPVPLVVQGRTLPWDGDADGSGPWARTIWVLGPTWLFETCNVAYRRSEVLRAGGFGGRLDGPVSPTGRVTGEDALLGWKVTGPDGVLRFEPAALVHHRHLPARYWDWVLEQRGRAVFPALVARDALGRRPLWHGRFLAPRTAAFDLAVAGALVSGAIRRPVAVLAAVVAGVPWVVLAWPEARSRGGRPALVRLVQLALGDAVGLAALAGSSFRHRRLVV